MTDHDFTLPPGVEVPELAATLDDAYEIAPLHDRALAALCRVVREQAAEKAELEEMLGLVITYGGEYRPYPCIEDEIEHLRRRVREEGEHE